MADGQENAAAGAGELLGRIGRHRAVEIPGRRLLPRAAVALVMKGEGPDLLFIRRAEREGDPWSGDMAFPGGRLEPGDASPLAAALRELWEETGMEPQSVAPAGRLSDVPTRTHAGFSPMIVTPYVLRLTAEPAWRENREVRERLWVPFPFLLDPGNRSVMIWRFLGRDWAVPCYDYQGRRIWGLSLIVIDELLALARGGRPGRGAWFLRLLHKE